MIAEQTRISSAGKQFFPLAGFWGYSAKGLCAVWTGEYRIPRKGEWYLSGAIIEAYKAPNTLGMKLHIAKIVRVREVVSHVIVDDNVKL